VKRWTVQTCWQGRWNDAASYDSWDEAMRDARLRWLSTLHVETRVVDCGGATAGYGTNRHFMPRPYEGIR